jgi:phage N-6-adenine-methyltransferase
VSIQGLGINLGDEYYTPKYVVEYFGEFDYDPATVAEKAKQFNISSFDTIETDGLSKEWGVHRRIWINPPFSKKCEFLKKAYQTFLESGSEIYVLLPITFLTTKKFSNLNITAKLFIPNRRISFERTDGVQRSSPSSGSVIMKLQSKNEVEYFDFNDCEEYDDKV